MFNNGIHVNKNNNKNLPHVLSIDIETSIVDGGHLSAAVLVATYPMVSEIPLGVSDTLLTITRVHLNCRISGAIMEAITTTVVLSWRLLQLHCYNGGHRNCGAITECTMTATQSQRPP